MKRIFFIITACIILVISGCGSPATETTKAASDGKLPVVVSFYAMEELARDIGGDKVTIHTIIPDGEEPHNFQPTASDLASLGTAKVFIMNGLGLEQSWSDKALNSAANKDILVVTASDGTDPIHVPSPHNTSADAVDPHVWLSLPNAKIEARNICDAFKKADPDNASYYEQRYTDFATKTDTLTKTYTERFAAVPQKSFVIGHAAFGYMARDFGLTQKSLTNVFASGEPSAHNLTELSAFCKANQIKVIFLENMESPKVAQTLANESGTSLENLDTLESSDGDKTYLDVMSTNLEKIYDSMK
ncbi:MAG: zinc ABC transporter substrate-binding protein [Megasphaera sp.]|jgi:zinc transport system substrate-binding protein|nr:zinc ABC transporter substrate-binding protein [Megasphaera sp.]MCI1248822.1 zinc ABC transporter substrate-binding protein [Megasphaera sp.]